jgi:hypothetical protein
MNPKTIIIGIFIAVILMAGHSKNFRKIAKGRKIAKKTNKEEYEIYAKPGELRQIIPFTEKTRQDNQEITDMGKNVVVMQNLFYEIPENSRVVLDIKIGKRTESKSQLLETKENNVIEAFFKGIKMYIYDRYTRSSTRGWRAIPVEKQNRANIGRNSEAFLKEQFDRINNKTATVASIVAQLEFIRHEMNKSQKTFIGSSILIIVDLQKPEKALVRLIDLAHPVDAKSKFFQKSKENFDEGIASLICFLKTIY